MSQFINIHIQVSIIETSQAYSKSTWTEVFIFSVYAARDDIKHLLFFFFYSLHCLCTLENLNDLYSGVNARNQAVSGQLRDEGLK